MLDEGRRTFRFDTFGDEAFWGGTLRLHEAIAGSAHGGVGPRRQSEDGAQRRPQGGHGRGACGGRRGTSRRHRQSRRSCEHAWRSSSRMPLSASPVVSTAIDSSRSASSAPSVIRRLTMRSCRGSGIASTDTRTAISTWAPSSRSHQDLSAYTKLLAVDEATVKKVLASWGPGKFDAELNPGRQGVPARRQARGDADPSGVWSCRREPSHLDGRLGRCDLLERVCRESRDAGTRQLLGSAVDEREAVSGRRALGVRQQAQQPGHGDGEARRAAVLSAGDSDAAAKARIV